MSKSGCYLLSSFVDLTGDVFPIVVIAFIFEATVGVHEVCSALIIDLASELCVCLLHVKVDAVIIHICAFCWSCWLSFAFRWSSSLMFTFCWLTSLMFTL